MYDFCNKGISSKARPETLLVMGKLSVFIKQIVVGFFVPNPFEGGGGYILNWVLFVQTILTCRYIHGR